MAAVRQVVSLSSKEINDALIERAKLAINNGKEGGPQIQGSTKVVINNPGDRTNDGASEGVTAEVIFERVGK